MSDLLARLQKSRGVLSLPFPKWKWIVLSGIFFLFLCWKATYSYAAYIPPAGDCGFSIRPLDENGRDVDRINGRNIYFKNWKKLDFSFDLNTIPKTYWNQFSNNASGVPNIFQRELTIRFASGLLCVTNFAGNFSYNTTSVLHYIHNPSDPFATCIATYPPPGPYTVKLLYTNDQRQSDQVLCQSDFVVSDLGKFDAKISIVPKNPADSIARYDVNSLWDVTISDITVPYAYQYISSVDILLDEKLLSGFKYLSGETGDPRLADPGNLSWDTSLGNSIPNTFHFTLNPLPKGDHTITVRQHFIGVGDRKIIKEATFTVLEKGQPAPTPTPDLDALCKGRAAPCFDSCSGSCNICPNCPGYNDPNKPYIQIPNLKPICKQLDTKFQGDCEECDRKGEIWSAIGCLPTDFSALVNKYVFTTGVGLAGGIAFLYFLYGAFMILTSSGNAEKMEEAKQIITSALAGLLLIIFSIFLLKTIGVDILKLPGFK